MTRIEFMRELSNRLRSISPAERDNVLNYYEEIFEEQEIDYTDSVPERYDPMKIARDILMNQQANKWEQTPPQKRKNRDGLLLILLGILSLPITLPLAAAFIGILIAIFAVIILLFVSGFMGIVGGIAGIAYFLTFSPLSAIFFLGVVFVAIGAIILLFNAIKFIIHKFAGGIARKSRPQNQNNFTEESQNNFQTDHFDNSDTDNFDTVKLDEDKNNEGDE